MKTRTQTLPIATYTNGKWELSEPYVYENRITCTIVGEMSDGTKVWEDANGNQFSRQRFFGQKYYFCKM